MNEQVTKYIHDATAGQKEMMLILRKLIHDTVKDVNEDFKWNRPVFSKTKGFAYFKTAKSHLTVGFMNFRKLHDPDKLLEGTGKDMRHIKLRSESDINTKLLTEWFLKASEQISIESD
jgi:hypothetical protein